TSGLRQPRRRQQSPTTSTLLSLAIRSGSLRRDLPALLLLRRGHSLAHRCPPVLRLLIPVCNLADELPPRVALPDIRESAGPINEDCQWLLVRDRRFCDGRLG